jgi:hypothetical protein
MVKLINESKGIRTDAFTFLGDFSLKLLNYECEHWGKGNIDEECKECPLNYRIRRYINDIDCIDVDFCIVELIKDRAYELLELPEPEEMFMIKDGL